MITVPYILQVFVPFFVKPIMIGFKEKYVFSKWHSSDTN